jgi:5'-phosphate synthase pdxT subunit
LRIGVLALQGAFREHKQVLQELGAEASEVRKPEHLRALDGLIIPGGESTTIRLLMDEYGLLAPLAAEIRSGLPTFGTCAGLIVLAKRVDGEAVPGLHALDIDVRRNAFGRQVDSFETDLAVPRLGNRPFHAVFIRAPIVESVDDSVEVLAQLADGPIVAVQRGSVLGAAFHPELSRDPRFHQYFLQVAGARDSTLVPALRGG